jgi:hypothetical protein
VKHLLTSVAVIAALAFAVPDRGATGQSIGRKLDGNAGSEPWRTGHDAL